MGVWLIVIVLGGLVVAAALAGRARGARRAEEAPPAGAAGAVPGEVDEDVQFTVYRPAALAPDRWYPLLAFAHRTAPVAGDGGVKVDPVAEVGRQAAAVLGADLPRFATAREESAAALPRGGDVTFVPVLPGCAVNPPSRTFAWTEPVHREEFRIRAPASAAGTTVRGHVAVYQGAALVAEVNVTLRVGGDEPGGPEPVAVDPVSARRFEKVFMSYSHRDTAVVELIEAVNILDVAYLRDCRLLRAGDDWTEQLDHLIAEADRFELFWSANAMESEQVAREWRYALALGRPGFVRPVYWEMPRPCSPERDLPPAELDRLHFQYLDFSAARRLQPAPGVAPPAPAGATPAARGRPVRLVAAGAAAAVAALLVAGGVSQLAQEPAGDDVASAPTTTPAAGLAPSGPPTQVAGDPALDALAAACGSDDLAACDDLWREAPQGSTYAAFASTCGGASRLEFAGTCTVAFDPGLDVLATACLDGDGHACTRLIAAAPPDTPYARLTGARPGTEAIDPTNQPNAPPPTRTDTGSAPTSIPSTTIPTRATVTP
jgi:hypothetical protein